NFAEGDVGPRAMCARTHRLSRTSPIATADFGRSFSGGEGSESRNLVAFSSSENGALSESRHSVHNMDNTALVATFRREVTMDEAKAAGLRGVTLPPGSARGMPGTVNLWYRVS